MFFWKGKGQIPFFKVHHHSTEKPKALVGFKPRTEPELGTGDSHSTSTPLQPYDRSVRKFTRSELAVTHTHTHIITNIKTVTGCRDSRSAKKQGNKVGMTA